MEEEQAHTEWDTSMTAKGRRRKTWKAGEIPVHHRAEQFGNTNGKKACYRSLRAGTVAPSTKIPYATPPPRSLKKIKWETIKTEKGWFDEYRSPTKRGRGVHTSPEGNGSRIRSLSWGASALVRSTEKVIWMD